MSKMVIITSADEIQEGAHFVSEEIYAEIALLIMSRTHPEWTRQSEPSAAAQYVDGMDFYGAIIYLQEAHRWLEAGFLDNAKFDLELGLKQLYAIDERKKGKAK